MYWGEGNWATTYLQEEDAEFSTPHTVTISKEGYRTRTIKYTMDRKREEVEALEDMDTAPPPVAPLEASIEDGDLTVSLSEGDLMVSIDDGSIEVAITDGGLTTSITDGSVEVEL